MTLRWLKVAEYDSGEFDRLFEAVFGHADPAHLPGMILVAEEGDEKAGFLSGYWRSATCFHIIYCGMLAKYANPVRTAAMLKQAMDMIGCPCFLTLVENTNRAATLAAFRAGFNPIGIRNDMDGKCYVEWAIRREHGLL